MSLFPTAVSNFAFVIQCLEAELTGHSTLSEECKLGPQNPPPLSCLSLLLGLPRHRGRSKKQKEGGRAYGISFFLPEFHSMGTKKVIPLTFVQSPHQCRKISYLSNANIPNAPEPSLCLRSSAPPKMTVASLKRDDDPPTLGDDDGDATLVALISFAHLKGEMGYDEHDSLIGGGGFPKRIMYQLTLYKFEPAFRGSPCDMRGKEGHEC